jgi:hypothetical protein
MTEEGGANREIIEAVRAMSGASKFKGAVFFIGEVTAVDEDNRECSLTATLGEDEIEYTEVHLSTERNDGLIEFPDIGSSVLCCKMGNGEIYVLKASDISKLFCYIDANNKFVFDSNGFVFNGGTLDGMVKVNSLVTKLNNIENKLNALITIIKTTWVPVAGDGGAALKTLLAAFTTLAATVKADLENPKIKQ